MELTGKHRNNNNDLVEEFSRSTSLTVFEIHQAAQKIIPGYLIANMMSPALWEWQKFRPIIGGDGKLKGTNSRLKELQRQFHQYRFTNDPSKPGGDPWGLLNFDDEKSRLGHEFVEQIRKEYDETLNHLLKLDEESQFGQIVEQDFYKEGYFPRLKNETIEGMDGYRRIDPEGKGSGKCVALAMLWASSLAVCCKLPLDQIFIVANKAHLFVFLDDGNTINFFNNGKWYNSTRISNDSELSRQARSVATGSDVMFIYMPGKGMCDIFNKKSEVEREAIEGIEAKCTEFLGAPLRVGDLDEVEFQVNEFAIPDPSDFETQADYRAAIYQLADEYPDSAFAHARYAYRDWKSTSPEVYAHASMREYEVGKAAKEVNTIQEALTIVESIENNESIFHSRDRIALPDETLLFQTGDDRDKALLLYTLIQRSEIDPESLKIGFGDCSSYVMCDGNWIDLSDLQIRQERPADLTHIFDHETSWYPDEIFKEQSDEITHQVLDAYDRHKEMKRDGMGRSTGIYPGLKSSV